MDSRRNTPENPIVVFFSGLLGAIIAFAICAAMSGCSPKVLTQYRDRLVYQDRIVRDSIFSHDSIYTREYVKGDTVRITEYRDRFVYKYVNRTDTLMIRDTLAVDRIKEVRVEKPLSAWQNLKIGAFWWLLGGLAAALIWIFRKQILCLITKLPRITST